MSGDYTNGPVIRARRSSGFALVPRRRVRFRQLARCRHRSQDCPIRTGRGEWQSGSDVPGPRARTISSTTASGGSVASITIAPRRR